MPATPEYAATVRWLSVTCLLCLGAPLPCHAWGRTAHEVIGYIAEQQLTPAAAAGVRRLLKGKHLYEPEVANWADDLTRHIPATGPWHYVNIPRGAGNYLPIRDCPDSNCVVAKIEEYQKQLADRTTPVAKRTDALRFLIHFVADAQQPLHCVDDGNRGGNDVAVTYRGRSTNLHQVWDTVLVDEDIGARTMRAFEAQLSRDVTPSVFTSLAHGTLSEWISQCHSDGEIIFDGLKLKGGREDVHLPDGYGREERESLELDIDKAAIRTARVLNEALAKEPVTPQTASHSKHRSKHRTHHPSS
jgi:hypothetical protein